MTPKLVTVFGGSGFIGRQVVRRLAALGCQVRVAVRCPEDALPLKTAGDVGQIVPVKVNIRQEHAVQAAVQGADAVINLVGILYETGTQQFEAVHEQGARLIAKAAKAAGVTNMVQMSALGASAESSSRYARSKAAAEAAVRAEIPEAVVIRPSVVFGPQDDFVNRFAALMRISPMLPLVGDGETKFQPVYVADVADAIVQSVTDPERAGRTYELGGPTVYSYRELMELIMRETGRHVGLVPLPYGLAKVKAFFLEFLPKPPLTRDQVELLKTDNICSGDLPGLDDFGIEATSAEIILPTYVDIYRVSGRYNPVQPV